MSRIPQISRYLGPQQSKPISAQSQLPRREQKQISRIPSTGLGRTQGKLARLIPTAPAKGSSQLQRNTFKDVLSQSRNAPGEKVEQIGANKSEFLYNKKAPIMRRTKRGEEQLLQEMTLETTVQRTPRAEYIGKTIRGTDVDRQSGKVQQLEVTSQQIDPHYATESAGVNQIVSVVSTVSVTTGGKQSKKLVKKKTTKVDSLLQNSNLNPYQIKRLVAEESNDVENILKILPPELVLSSVDKHHLKKKLHELRLSSQPMSVLAQSVALPIPTADDIVEDPSPETMFSIIHAIEKKATADVAPNQIFNSIFPDVQETEIAVCSASPGPLEDIIVPLSPAREMTDELLTTDINTAAADCQLNHTHLRNDICIRENIMPIERTSKRDKKIPMILDQEIAPWKDSSVQKLAVLVGGDPIHLLDTSNELEFGENKSVMHEMPEKIDFIIDANTTPFETKVQLRGSKLPPWFPGYMAAFPHLPDVVHIAKSPSGVLHTAWKSVQPKFLPLENIIFNSTEIA